MTLSLGEGCRESQSGLPTPRLTSLPCAVLRSHEGQHLGGIEAADSSDNHCVVRERGERPWHANRQEGNS
jgi:hypothetical protein